MEIILASGYTAFCQNDGVAADNECIGIIFCNIAGFGSGKKFRDFFSLPVFGIDFLCSGGQTDCRAGRILF